MAVIDGLISVTSFLYQYGGQYFSSQGLGGERESQLCGTARENGWSHEPEWWGTEDYQPWTQVRTWKMRLKHQGGLLIDWML